MRRRAAVFLTRPAAASRPPMPLQNNGLPRFDPCTEKGKPGDKLLLTGEVTRVDEDDRMVTLKAGGLITVDVDTITHWTPVLCKKNSA